MNKGYIALHRSLLDWEWYNDLPVRCLFIHLLLKANHKTKKYKNKIIKRGQYLIGRGNLALESGLTIQQVRTAILKLKSTNEITSETTNGYHLIKLVNYEVYQKTKEDINQQNNQSSNQQITNDQPTDNQRITTNNNEKNDNNLNPSNPILKNPPSPLKKEKGVLKNIKGGSDIINQLSEDELNKAKSNAPQWDIYHLAQVYFEGMKRRGEPDNLNLAFIGWCIKYTKGKAP